MIKYFLLFFVLCCMTNLACKKKITTDETALSAVSKDSIDLLNNTLSSEDTISSNTLDTLEYKNLLSALAKEDTAGIWPPKAPYPKLGAILPYHRIIAFYGNLYSKRMGILGELPEKEMLAQLQTEVQKWEQADSLTPVIPALHYIAVTAQRRPARGGKYRQRMPEAQIDTILKMAKKIDALVFLDFQIGQSTLQEELPLLEKYFKMPHVHLGIDPEFSMKNGNRPGRRIGTFDAADINYAAAYLDSLVTANDLPPKVLVVHRFTKEMVTDYENIEPLSTVQILIHVDGWGVPANKRANYKRVAYPEPVQFTGFKIFYKNDTRTVGRREVMQPADMLELVPKPIYIQYQ